jgi:hypothetical protein
MGISLGILTLILFVRRGLYIFSWCSHGNRKWDGKRRRDPNGNGFPNFVGGIDLLMKE